MGVKTVCEDLFGLKYKNALREEDPISYLDGYLKSLESTVHSIRLFYYLTLVGKELGVDLPQETEFSKAFKSLLEEVLKTFYRRYSENFPSVDEETFVNTFLVGSKFNITQIEGYIEDLIILLLGFVVDKTLSEVYTTTKIKNLLKERMEQV